MSTHPVNQYTLSIHHLVNIPSHILQEKQCLIPSSQVSQTTHTHTRSHPLNHPVNAPCQPTLSTHPINTPSQPTQSTHHINTPSQPPLNNPPCFSFQAAFLSTHPLITPSQPPFNNPPCFSFQAASLSFSKWPPSTINIPGI